MVFVNPKYLQRSERGTFRDFTRYHLGGNFIYHNTSAFSTSVENKFVAGLDEAYQDGAILFYGLSSTNGRGTDLRDNKREGANTFGAFIQDELIINNKLSVLIGARYDNVSYHTESFFTAGYGLQTRSFEKITPKAGVTYRLSSTHSVYANFGGGIEVPAGNETDPSSTFGDDKIYLINPLLDAIISTTYEVGTKQIIAIDKSELIKFINYDFALYYIDIKNDIIPYRGGRFYFTAGKTTRVGAELGGSIQLKNGFSLNAAFTYSNNQYKEYLIDSVHYDSKKAGKYADYKDNKVAGIPDVFYNASLTYSPEILNGAFVSISLNGIGKYFVDDANNISVPAFNAINATIGMNEPIKLAGSLAVKGFINFNNIFDTKYAGSAFINPDIVNNEAIFLEPGLPRNIVLSISLSY
jgi:iron complex outermembrane receptor protein